MTGACRGNRGHLDGVARVWAQATAARDGLAEPAPLAVARPVISRALDHPGSLLAVTLAGDGDVTAFALAAPVPPPPIPPGAEPPSTAEIHYLGVQPAQWGAGLAGQVLDFLCRELAAAGFRRARLLVYTDNPRAVALYQRLGWQPAGPPASHPRTGRPEQRYEIALPPVS